jgi:phenylacetate-CoA ligase
MMLKIESEAILRDLKTKKEDYWLQVKEKEILRLFHSTSKRVLAYKDFLKKHRIDPKKIKTLKDFELVPLINKNNYLRVYPYEKLVCDENIKKPITIHSTSGSTGEPTYFQRELKFDLRREIIIENFFRYNEITITGPTLLVIAFGMGVWSAGTGIYTASYLATNINKFPISIISPGVNKIEVLKILRKLAPNFKQVIIAGYPPLVKDVIDDALYENINIRKFNLRFIFTGENFTEEFRNYLSDKVGIKNIFIDTMNTYGTSELGPVAVETPLTILVMRLAHTHQNIFRGLFGDIIKTPTLAQYIPYFINFECVNGELFFTGDNTIPLVKYQSGDHGGILTFKQLKEILSKNGVSLEDEAKKLGISKYIYELPLVFVYERKNLCTTLYGILIYPEFIKTALFDKKLSRFLTSKYTMITKYDRKQNQYLEINLELKRGVGFKKHYKKIALKRIVEVLKEKSSEFRELSDNLKERTHPKLVFWSYEYPKYFTPGTKQNWVKKI